MKFTHKDTLQATEKSLLNFIDFFLQFKFPSPHGLLSFLFRGEYEVKIQFYCIFYIIICNHIVEY